MTDPFYKVGNELTHYLKITEQVVRIAINSFPLLPHSIKEKMQQVLRLLQTQPDTTFSDIQSERFKVFTIAADCFSHLNTNITVENLALAPRNITSIIHPSEEWCLLGSLRPSNADTDLYAISTLPQLPTDLFPCVNPTADLLNDWEVVASQTPMLDLSQSSLFHPLDPSPLQLDESSEAAKALSASKLHQFQSIERFGTSFLMEYGDFILSDVTTALLNTTRSEKRKEHFLSLVQQAVTATTKGSDPFYSSMQLLLLKALGKNIHLLIEDISLLIRTAIKSPDFCPDFCHLLIEKCFPLCFDDFHITPVDKKRFFLRQIQSVCNFLEDLNLSIENVSKASNCGISVELEEQLLIIEMNRKMIARGLPILVPNHRNPQSIEDNIFNATERMLKQRLGPEFSNDPTQSLILFVMTSTFSHMLNRIFSSDGLCIIMDILSELPTPKAPEASAHEKKQPLEVAFTKALTAQVQRAVCEFFKLSGASQSMHDLLKSTLSKITSPTENVAIKLHELFEEYFVTKEINEVLMMPIVILNQLLFGPSTDADIDSNSSENLLLNYLHMDANAFSAVKQRVDTQFQTKSEEFFKKIISTQCSWIITKLINATTDTFSQGMAKRLHRLSKQDKVIKMLISYMFFCEPQVFQRQESGATNKG